MTETMSTTSELVTVPKLENKPQKTDLVHEDAFDKSKLDVKKDLSNGKENENGLIDEPLTLNGINVKMDVDVKVNGVTEIDHGKISDEKANDTSASDDDDDEDQLLIDTQDDDETSKSKDENEKHLQNGDVEHFITSNEDRDLKSIDTSEIEVSNESHDYKKLIRDEDSEKYSETRMEVDFDKENVIQTDKITDSKADILAIKEHEKCEDEPMTENEEESRQQRLKLQSDRVENLKEELRREEATLSLLRKLLDSQRGKNGYKSIKAMPPSNPVIKQQQQPGAAKPPSLNKPAPPNQKPSHGLTQAPSQKYYIQVGNQLVPAPPPTSTGSNTVYQYNGSNSHSYQPPAKPAPPPPPKQTPEQKKNAAKAALRRQLEQTLLQIPPPRPPPADWKAVPNVNSMDFMMLVGLDEVVDTILLLDNKPTLKSALEELSPFNPRVCSQCKVDFSPCWKASKNSTMDGFVLCERCSLQNVKKELKAEHTSRLKSAFMKALKQEQEIEEKIKAGEDINIPNVPGIEKETASHTNVVQHQQSNRISSPKLPLSSQQSVRSTSGHAPSPTERERERDRERDRERERERDRERDRDRHHQSNGGHHHRHQVVQHYPHHSSLVQQLHHQHIQQQQLELEPSPRHSSHSSRWHPYIPSSSSHHREHHPVHHRSYVPASSSTPDGSPHQEYYVVHHPHHYVPR